eukprot:CAMPEP_0113309296 /NCGR_PEP_ID=MMETSP0010_2-20120614/7402_1 /TAXON_ID=216773 ORGANISM="Corethron hystrix, Strain 308" /NCGR_SAMPLE_ID=MMETSP0010_2 /ASSEMBLY_ACC=CAM_ASM_000155 /LENGTH=74 /DNA_ID=CAMNT_0000164531 /DNA_START=520 /DNA_END=744 /DNA_ORIENTATION=+ /assembly_acc=CAM_ASM_000155
MPIAPYAPAEPYAPAAPYALTAPTAPPAPFAPETAAEAGLEEDLLWRLEALENMKYLLTEQEYADKGAEILGAL